MQSAARLPGFVCALVFAVGALLSDSASAASRTAALDCKIRTSCTATAGCIDAPEDVAVTYVPASDGPGLLDVGGNRVRLDLTDTADGRRFVVFALAESGTTMMVSVGPDDRVAVTGHTVAGGATIAYTMHGTCEGAQ